MQHATGRLCCVMQRHRHMSGNCLSLDLLRNRFLASFILLTEIDKTWNVNFINTKVIYFGCDYMLLDKCVFVNSGSVYTDVFVYYCSLLYTILCRSVETVVEYRLNGFLKPFVEALNFLSSSVRIFYSKRLKRFEDPLKRFHKAFAIRSLSVFLPVLMQNR
jgi:hypothetical protein